MAQSEFGELKVFEDFLGIDPDYTWAAGGFAIGQVSIASVNEGSIESTVDESGGVVAITSDTGDNDNFAMYSAPMVAGSNGPLAMEARFKLDNVTTLSSVFCGFTETLDKSTPVMPAEFATATMTYNGTGAMAGIQFDIDGTTDDFRAVFGDAGRLSPATVLTPMAPVRTPLTADRWYIVRVEIDPNGAARVYFGDGTNTSQMKLIKSIPDGIPTDVVLFPVLMQENRTAGAVVTEVDYFYARGYRDWNAN